VQYGPRVTAIIVYLYVGQFLSKKRTAAALAELFGTPVSEGTVATMTARAAEGLEEFLHVTDRLAEAEVAGFDETGLRAGRPAALVALRPHRQVHPDHLPSQARPGRASAASPVHDAWAPYDTYLDVTHQLCCAHAQRELAGVADAAPVEKDWCWATQAADAPRWPCRS